MANGLLEHPKQNQEWEDVGKRYLNELLLRCLIQKQNEFCLYFTFRMHDLVHDLALDVSQKECQKECKTVNSETETVDKYVRHLLLCDEKLVGVPRVSEEMKNVQTYLRALELTDSPLTALPNSIGTLNHLRDLNLGGCGSVRKLPRSFDKLRSLQSLYLGGTGLKQLPDSLQRELECLPEGMQNLQSLRTLVVSGCVNLVSLPRSLKFLTKLEHLEIVDCLRINLKMEPEEEEDKDLQLSLQTLLLVGSRDLTDLPQLLLQGSSSTLQQLRIKYCSDLSVLPAWLLNLTSLHKLEIEGCRNLSALPEGIDRLTNLRELRIIGCPELSKRYGENGGEDWHKIAHIQ
ncbi:hypothetical protein Gotur_027759, partial [Gossypium turneri]